MADRRNCAAIRRELLTEPASARTRAVAEHLQGCSACARFAKRSEAAGEFFKEHRGRFVPEAGFVSKVVESLPAARRRSGDEGDSMGWAAMRLLPATLALAVILVTWCWMRTDSPASLAESSTTDDLLTWVLADEEDS